MSMALVSVRQGTHDSDLEQQSHVGENGIIKWIGIRISGAKWM